MGSIVHIEFSPQDSLEFRLALAEEVPQVPRKKFTVVSPKQAYDHRMESYDSRVIVFRMNGGQPGDEGKAKAAKRLAQLLLRTWDPRAPSTGWVMAPEGTHNAGKGVTTTNKQDEPVRFSLNLTPPTVDDPRIRNYIGRDCRVNLHTQEAEVLLFQKMTGKTTLGEEYHLATDMHTSLALPINRCDDIVGKKNAMGSTIAGSSASAAAVATKTAPMMYDVLHRPERFKTLVGKQIAGFEMRVQADPILKENGITSMRDLGDALLDATRREKDERLEALHKKLRPEEVESLRTDDPAQYLLNEYRRILQADLFDVVDVDRKINEHIDAGHPGGLESVQGTILSGGLRIKDNRTATHTHGSATLGHANLPLDKVYLRRFLAMKYPNTIVGTAVGASSPTLSGLIAQDAMHNTIGIHPSSGQQVSLEYTSTLTDIFEPDEIAVGYQQVSAAFYEAMKAGHSLQKSTVRIPKLDVTVPLAVANAIFSAVYHGETGETSGRNRTCRLHDMVETGYVLEKDHFPFLVWNAIDRMVGAPSIGVVVGYEVHSPFEDHMEGDIISPTVRMEGTTQYGTPIFNEEMLVDHCRPLIHLLEAPTALTASGRNDLEEGDELDPRLSAVLSLCSGGAQVVAVGYSPRPEDMAYLSSQPL